MEIKLIRFLSSHPNALISQINHHLHQNSLATLSLIAKFNSVEPNLILQKNGRYYLSRIMDWLSETSLTALLAQHQLNYQVKIFDQIDSTNSYALRHIEQFAHKSILSTNWQHSGRGRFGRSWSTTIAHDLTVSLIYHFPPSFNVALLPTICAVAVNRVLKNHGIANTIKWPNDIYHDGAKVAGILVENLLRNSQNNTVIGIGLNNFANWERNKLLVEIVIVLDNILQEFQLFGFALIRREWLDNCMHLNQAVSIKQNGVEIEHGIHKDISEQGELIISSDSGEQIYSSSAISLIIL